MHFSYWVGAVRAQSHRKRPQPQPPVAAHGILDPHARHGGYVISRRSIASTPRRLF